MTKTILVADDNPAIRESLCKMFEAEEEYGICAEASNGEEAITLAKQYRPDLVILDLLMPFLNGYDTARKLKWIMPTVPIILFTLYADTVRNHMMGMNSPVDLVVAKTEAANLIGHVRSLIPVAYLG
jgi:DNA-binding NarL/FixJ family response regulator